MTASDRTRSLLSQALNKVLQSESVKGLRRRGVKDVHVVTRRDFEAAIAKAVEAQGPSQASPVMDSSKKRVELLLIEIERLRKEKSDLEHQKGLLENERANLRGRLDEIVNAGSKAAGEKVTVEDIQALLRDRDELRAEVEALRERMDEARVSSEEEITSLRVRQSELEQEREELHSEVAQGRGDVERLRSDLEASRTLAATNKRRCLELEQELAEERSNHDVTRARIADLEAQVKEREARIEALENPPEPEPEAEPEPRTSRFGVGASSESGARRPATRRLSRTTRASPAPRRGAKDTTSLDFSFASGQPRTGRTTRRRRRLS